MHLRLLRPLRHRDFGLLWSGMSISVIGDGIYSVGLAWQVYLLSDAPTALSIVGAAATLPHVLIVLFAGILSDRFERRRILIAADLVRGLSVALVGLLGATGQLALWHLVVLTATYGVGEALFGPAFTALVPDLVPHDELAQANALDAVVRPLGLSLVGPAIGGFLIAGAGAPTAFLLDAASFGVSIVALVLLQPRPMAPRGTPQAIRQDLLDGLAYVRRHTWLWGTLCAASISLLFFMGPLRVLVPFIVKNDLNGSASDLGLIYAAGGVGAIGASLAFSQVGVPRRAIVIMFVGWGVSIYLMAFFGVATNLWQAAAVMFAIQALGAIGQLIWATLLGTHVPRELLGRVSSLDWLISIGLVPVSFAATGPIAEQFGTQATLLWGGVIGGTVFLAFLFLPGMRDVERQPSLTSEQLV